MDDAEIARRRNTVDRTTRVRPTLAALRKLQDDRAAQKSGETSVAGLKGLTPSLALPSDLGTPAPAGPMPAADSTAKPGSGPNWLLDGYDKLKSERSPARPGKADAAPLFLD